jgi:hypothetical protein
MRCMDKKCAIGDEDQIRSLGRTIEIVELCYRKKPLVVETGVNRQLMNSLRYRK